MLSNLAVGSTESEPLAFLSGGGAMGGLIRSMDWSATALGPIAAWPPGLRALVSQCLASNLPMSIIWGPGHTLIYNDAYLPICGGRHPRALGQSFRECWAAAWGVMAEPFGRALEGRAAWLENQPVLLERNGRMQEDCFTFSLSPIRDDEGRVAGVLHLAIETAPSDEAARERAKRELQRAHDELEDSNARLVAEIAERKRAERARNELLRQLATAHEDERRRVARDLHDSIGQVVTGLSLALKAAASAADLPAAPRARLAEAQRVADQLGRDVHDLALRLRPASLDDLGLEAAVQDLVSGWAQRTGVRAECAISLGRSRLTHEIETTLYRVVQEALTNVAKHAGASVVSVVFTRVDGYVTAVVEDDGKGFNPEATPAARLGLLGMGERASLVGGELDIESKPGWGTTVLVRIPLPADVPGDLLGVSPRSAPR